MKNIKIEALLLLLSGFVIIGSALFIYFYIDKTYPDSTSSRVQDLNWLLDNIGKLPLSILLFLVGLIPVYFGYKRLKK